MWQASRAAPIATTVALAAAVAAVCAAVAAVAAVCAATIDPSAPCAAPRLAPEALSNRDAQLDFRLFSASNCVDGDLGEFGRNICHSSTETNPSLTLDLGTAKQVAYVAVYNRRDCCKERLGRYTVSLRLGSSDAWTLCSEETAERKAFGPLLSTPARSWRSTFGCSCHGQPWWLW